MFGVQRLQQLYGGSPNVSFFKGDGEPQLGSILDMPDNSSSGAIWDPPDGESVNQFNTLACHACDPRSVYNSTHTQCCGVRYYPG